VGLVFFARRVRQDDDANPGGCRVGPKLLEELDSRDPRHEQVEQNQIGRYFAGHLQADFAVHCRPHDKPALLKTHLAGSTEKPIVFNDEDRQRLAHNT
jgi:hypothetical protein